MPILAFVFEQLMQVKYGVGGSLIALLVLLGIKTKSETYQGLALAVLLVMLF
jgi:hypothetical protein